MLSKVSSPTGNFPVAYDPNRKLKILTGHFPTSDNVNRNMSKKKFTAYQIFLAHVWCNNHMGFKTPHVHMDIESPLIIMLS